MRQNRLIVRVLGITLVCLMLGYMLPLGLSELVEASTDVPYFSQNDSRWACDPMVVTSTDEIIGNIGTGDA